MGRVLALLGSEDDPVDVSDIDDPDEENMGSDRSEGEGEGGFCLSPPGPPGPPPRRLLTRGDSNRRGETTVSCDAPEGGSDVMDDVMMGEETVPAVALLTDRSTAETRRRGLYLGPSLNGTAKKQGQVGQVIVSLEQRNYLI